MIGIAIPSYNMAGTLQETLRSCTNQTFRDWIAVVTVEGDDASRESEIVRRLGDARIRVECNGTRLGQMANFNRAILRCYAAGAKWIKTLSADDVLYPDTLERMLSLGESSASCGLVFGYFDVVDETGALTGGFDIGDIASQVVSSATFTREIVPFGNPTGGPSSVMFRAEAVERAGLFDGMLNFSGDREFWFRMARCFDVGVVGRRAVLAYRQHENSVSGREKALAVRFEQPMDIARRITARFPPYSRDWLLGHVQNGRAAAANLITCISWLRRGNWRVAATGVAATVRRLTPLSLPVAIEQFTRMSIRLLMGRQPGTPRKFDPKGVSHVSANTGKTLGDTT